MKVRYTLHVTHEQFIQSVRDLAVEYASNVHTGDNALDAEALKRVARAKLLYGRGHFGLRGVTQYGAWHNGDKDELIEVCAASEESWVQLAGTTIHELAHAATGMGHGHNKAWKEACAALGLRRVKAVGTVYHLAMFAPELRAKLAEIDKPADGMPALAAGLLAGITQNIKARPCTAGIGVRGGKSRGVGSGSRLRKYTCDGIIEIDGQPRVHGQIIRASTDHLEAHCDVCGGKFVMEA
jgi:hypothetical protein